MDNIIAVREQRQKIFNGKYDGCNCFGGECYIPVAIPCTSCPLRDCSIAFALYEEVEPRNFIPYPLCPELTALYPLWENLIGGRN